MASDTTSGTAEDGVDTGFRVTEYGANIMCLFGTMFMFHAGYVSFGVDLPAAVYTALVIFPWLAGLLLAGFALSPVDPRPFGRWLAFVVVAGVLAGDLAATYSASPELFRFGTDTLLFSRRAVDLLVAGTNPYAVDLTPVPYPVNAQKTPLLGGGHVSTFSYPAGSILAYLPQRLTGIGRFPMHLTALTATVASVTYLVLVSPREVAVAPALVFSGMGMYTDATGGIIDALWLFPLLLAMHALATREDWLRTGVWFGIAASMKQQPWLIAPFLLVWAVQSTGWRAGSRLVAASTASFLAVNLPFIAWNPVAWLEGVFTPLGAHGTLIPQGVGFTVIRTSGLLELPKTTFTLLVAVLALGLLAAYALRARGRWRWLAWVMPVFILFGHWRSLPSYFVWYLPVFWMAYLAATDSVCCPHTTTDADAHPHPHANESPDTPA